MDESWQSSDDGNEWASWPPSISSDESDGPGNEDRYDSGSAPAMDAPLPPVAAPNLEELRRAQSELWTALRREEDPDVRMHLLSQLSENRAATMQLGRSAPLAWSAGTASVDERAQPTQSAADPGPAVDGLAVHGSLSKVVAGYGQDPIDRSAGYQLSGHDTAANGPSQFGREGHGVPGPSAVADAQRVTPRAPSYDYPQPARSRYQIGSPEADRGYDALDAAPSFPRRTSGRPPSTLPPPRDDDLIASRPVPAPARAGDRSLANIASFAGPHSGQRALILLGALLSVFGVTWLILAHPFGRGGETSAGGDRATFADESGDVSRISAVLQSMGLDGVTVEQRDDGLHLIGTVASEPERATAVSVVQALVGEGVTVVSELAVRATPASLAPAPDAEAAARAAAMQAEINRVVAATPLIFETGKTDITELHIRILNNVASIFKAYPGMPVKVIGYTDHVGSDDANVTLSSARAANVKAYLASQGVPVTDLITEARGSSTSTGSDELASLERRVSFEVVTVPAVPTSAPLRIAVVAPSARNDLAFTQSMIDAINLVAAERGNVAVDITDSTFVPAEAAAAIKRYAADDYDLIVAHGVEFGTELLDIVKAHPDIVFAWGTATDTFGLPNLYAYDAAAEQGGYVMGAMAAMLSAKGTVGVVGPIEVADAKRYVDGFKSGALAERPALHVPITYTGSFADIVLASEAADAQVAAGADVLTGTAEMVVGAISVARDNHALWFGTQANQASLAPDIVVASQVYHWEVLLRPIVADIDAGRPNGRGLVATLADGGLVLEYNPGYPLADPVKQRAEQLGADIRSGALVVTGG